jgi:CRISPR-associated protein Csc3
MTRAVSKVIDSLGEPDRPAPFVFLEPYVAQVLSLGDARQRWDFSGELSRYTANKKPRSGQRVCALCNSNFEVRADYSTYSNKQVVGYADAKRGICEVCQAERLLRRFTLGRGILADEGTKFLHLYPTFFFTPITAEVMRRAYDNFKNVVFTDIIKPYQKSDYDVRALLHVDVLQVLEPPNPKRRLDRVDYPEGQMHGYYLLGVPFLGRDPSDTENWVMPPLLALLTPLLFGTKVAVSDAALPPYTSGADFPETVRIDAPHSFWQHAMKKTSFRLDEVQSALQASIALYGVLSEAFKDGSGYAIWNQLGAVARALDSDPLAVFGYADRISQANKGTGTTTDGMTPFMAERLTTYYDHITGYYSRCRLGGTNEMKMIRELVDKYAKFYRARGGKGKSASAFSRLRPLNLAIDTILRSPPEEELDNESLRFQINGVLLAFLDRIRSGDPTITGRIPKGMYGNAELIPAVEAFTEYMVDEVFGRYCLNDRSLLRKRLNLLKNGCEAYYMTAYGSKKADDAATSPDEADETDSTLDDETPAEETTHV